MNVWWRSRPSKHGKSTWPAILGLLTIPLVGLADYSVGYEISFLVFYLPSIALVGWVGGSGFGIIAAIASAGAWLIADVGAQRPLNMPIAFANAGLRFLVFLAFGLLFAVLRQNRDRLEESVRNKTEELQNEITERLRIQREVSETSAKQQRQIAYDLHDGIGQHLSGIAFKSKLLEQKLRREGSAQADEVAAITNLINDALRQTRMVARNLESSYGEARGLKEALAKLAAELQSNSNVSAVVNVDDSCGTVPAPADVQLFRIVQEAAHNATNHGEAHRININLQTDDGDLVLTIADDGKGFDGLPREGMGMRTMHYRAETIGGSLSVASKRGSGTTVSCRIPKAGRDIAANGWIPQ